jgi:ABC-type bacteriocin/lantibiotic exporter with double-glycine peptidase domain
VKERPEVYGPKASNNGNMGLLEAEEVSTLKVPRLKQKYDHDCGVAVLRAVVKMTGAEIDQDKLVDIVKPSEEKGTSVNKLFAMIQKVDADAKLLKNPSVDRLRSMIAKKTPVITCMQAYSEGHWVIVTGVDEKYVHLHDPYTGDTRKVSIDDLDKRWKSRDKNEGRVAIQLSLSVPLTKVPSKPLKESFSDWLDSR